MTADDTADVQAHELALAAACHIIIDDRGDTLRWRTTRQGRSAIIRAAAEYALTRRRRLDDRTRP